MADAARDNNRNTTLLGVSSSDGTTVVPIKVNPVTNAMKVDGLGASFGDSVTGSSGDGFTINNTGTGRSLFLNQDGNGIALEIDAESTTTEVLRCHAATTTTGTIFSFQNCNSLTTGRMAYFHSNSADTGTRQLVRIDNANALATGATALHILQASTADAIFIDQDGNGSSINIDSESTTANVLSIANATTTGTILRMADSNALTTGRMALFESNSTDGSSRDLIQITNGQAAAAGTKCLKITQGAPANALVVDQNSSSASTIWAVSIDSDNAGAGIGGGIDFSNMGGGDVKFKFVADATDPTGGGGAANGRIAIDVGGSIVYIPYY
jgi:hypothetical protein